MKRFLAPALVMFPLLGGVSTEAATFATNDPLGILENHAPLINQTEDRAIVKVAEWCGTGSFRDEYGRCRIWRSVNHSGGRCVPNY